MEPKVLHVTPKMQPNTTSSQWINYIYSYWDHPRYQQTLGRHQEPLEKWSTKMKTPKYNLSCEDARDKFPSLFTSHIRARSNPKDGLVEKYFSNGLNNQDSSNNTSNSDQLERMKQNRCAMQNETGVRKDSQAHNYENLSNSKINGANNLDDHTEHLENVSMKNIQYETNNLAYSGNKNYENISHIMAHLSDNYKKKSHEYRSMTDNFSNYSNYCNIGEYPRQSGQNNEKFVIPKGAYYRFLSGVLRSNFGKFH